MTLVFLSIVEQNKILYNRPILLASLYKVIGIRRFILR
ncbi:hypothetical protein GXM_08455 [Nostoc sphaeroides CCNUC1]|uniref:Uncharacterized protein n=1 Tax=Nostoc sphaeroides CCNUC1 TaxID=2653204 RepID=A0A5P8WEH1_9NOSO|nr:hypothetical protein GXM_08455 [Nostoc sphaeroides CCNUC1]